ncbi:MAG: radical SAM protein [Actinobacteria bacterium]|nr:radical SAM protein [Actinomycetota bacterium]
MDGVRILSLIVGMSNALRGVERRTRPVDPEFAAVLHRRWAELPQHVKTPGQFLGRHAVGCEGTHGVFPRCNMACTPCYHSRDANRVRVDGSHTLAEVDKQMALLRRLRGPRAHAQLIGGEVTLLSPDDHAATLLTMRRYGREPMSMSHGDFDPDYLERLALDEQGRPRLRRLSFAGHFDMFMFGRRGIPRPGSERELNPYRQRFVDMFKNLRIKHGVRSFLAHNMTVTPANLGQVADLVRDCHAMGFGMFSFQPAAFVGDHRRWHENYKQVGMDQVWREIEKGAGTTLDYTVIQHGDLRCNRAAYGFYVGPRWHPFLSGDDPRDLDAREAFFRYLGEVNFAGVELPDLLGKLLRSVVRHPVILKLATQWIVRLVRRVGGVRALLRHGVRPVSFVVHQFMDAADVAPAWELMQRGETASDPRILATQERLASCHYAMAHPETGELVPACVQHSVLDPVENVELRRLLPIVDVRAS